MQNPLNIQSGNQLVEEYIGTAYDKVKAVAEQLVDIGVLASTDTQTRMTNILANISDISNVGDSIIAINEISAEVSKLVEVADNLNDITIAADNTGAINTVADNLDAITLSNTNAQDINEVADKITEIAAIGTAITEVIELANNLDRIALALNGWTILGSFGDIFTVEKRNQLVQDSNGITYRYTGILPFTSTSGTVPDSAWTTIDVSSGRRINIADQEGSNTNLKMIKALEVAKRGDVVVGHALLVANPVTAYVIPEGVTVEGGWMKIQPLTPITNIIKYESNKSNQRVTECIIDANANNLGAAISGKGNVNPVFDNNELFNFTKTGIDFRSYMENGTRVPTVNDKPLVNPVVTHNRLHTPAAGVGHPILITSGIGGHFVQGGRTRNNVITGCDPTDPLKPNGDYTASNSFVADAIALQGVWDHICSFNRFLHCGSAGVSFGRVSGRSTIHNNYGYDLFEPVVNCGTAYTIIEVDDTTGFTQWDTTNIASSINPNSTGSTAVTGQIAFVDPLTNRIGFDSTFGTEWLIGETLTQGVTTAIITDVFASAEDMEVYNNIGLDVCQGDTSVAGINCIRTSGQTVIMNNTILAPLNKGTVKVLNNANGQVGFSANTPSYESDPTKYAKTGTMSEWLFEEVALNNINELLDGEGETLIINAGQITVTHKYHKIDTENGDPLDRLTTINSNVANGAVLNLSVVAGARQVYLQDGAGVKVGTASGKVQLPTTGEVLNLVKNGSQWVIPNAGINAFNGARLQRGRGADLVINSNEINITHEIHEIDTENSDPTDVITNIAGDYDEGAKLYLFIKTSSRQVTFTNSQTLTVENSPYTLLVPNDILALTYINGKWRTASGVANLL